MSKKDIGYQYDLHKFLIKDFIRGIHCLIKNGEYQPRNYIVNKKKKLIYLHVPKVATSSIVSSVIGKDVPDDYSIHSISNIVHTLSTTQNKYYKFSFVRNPFERLVSCYESKYHKDKKYKKELTFMVYDYYLLGYLHKDKGFDNFIYKVVRIPDALCDYHFKPQSRILYDNTGKSLVDFIGKYEDLDRDFNQLQQKYELRPLPHLNQTKHADWRDYYTLETAKLVYRKYYKDIQLFGYKYIYKDLIEYIKLRSKK